MRLSIVNYGTSAIVNVPAYAKREDDAILKSVKEIIAAQNMGKGAAIVSEVLHTDLRNGNMRSYMKKGMDVAAQSFYAPHFTPFLMHHEMGGGGFLSSGDPKLVSVGSNVYAQYFRKAVETATGPASGYLKVGTFVSDSTKIGETLAIDAIQSRRLMSLSIGARVADEDYRCSICGKSRYDEECDHSLGKEYDGQMCFVEVYNPFFREYSAVYNPSDINAVIRRMDVEEAEGSVKEEHLVDMMDSLIHLNVYEVTGAKVFPSAPIPSEESAMKTKEELAAEAAAEAAKGGVSAELIASYEEAIKARDAIITKKDEVIAVLAASLKDKIDALNAFATDSAETEPEGGEPAASTETHEDGNGTDAPPAQPAAPATESAPDPAPAAPASDVATETEVQGSAAPETTPDAPQTTETTDQPAEDPPATEETGESSEVERVDLRSHLLSGSLTNLGNRIAKKKSVLQNEDTAAGKEGAPYTFRSLHEVIRDKH